MPRVELFRASVVFVVCSFYRFLHSSLILYIPCNVEAPHTGFSPRAFSFLFFSPFFSFFSSFIRLPIRTSGARLILPDQRTFALSLSLALSFSLSLCLCVFLYLSRFFFRLFFHRRVRRDDGLYYCTGCGGLGGAQAAVAAREWERPLCRRGQSIRRDACERRTGLSCCCCSAAPLLSAAVFTHRSWLSVVESRGQLLLNLVFPDRVSSRYCNSSPCALALAKFPGRTSEIAWVSKYFYKLSAVKKKIEFCFSFFLGIDELYSCVVFGAGSWSIQF